MIGYVREAVRRKRQQFRINLDPPVIVQPLDGRGEIRGRRGESANLLRWGDGEHGMDLVWRATGGGRKKERSDVIEASRS